MLLDFHQYHLIASTFSFHFHFKMLKLATGKASRSIKESGYWLYSMLKSCPSSGHLFCFPLPEKVSKIILADQTFSITLPKDVCVS